MVACAVVGFKERRGALPGAFNPSLVQDWGCQGLEVLRLGSGFLRWSHAGPLAYAVGVALVQHLDAAAIWPASVCLR